jgi:predicted aspartyl protease
MIQGTFGDRGQLFFEIELIGINGFNLPVDAMLDTGFTGFLAINKQDLDALNWQFIRE